MEIAANIPMRFVGPIHIKGRWLAGDSEVPLATYETPLWPSVDRGARVSVHAGGIALTLVHERMTRSVLVEALMPLLRSRRFMKLKKQKRITRK